MSKKGNLINICLYSGALGEWFEFTKKSKRRLPDEWVTITGVEERKKGATTYYVPVFAYNKSLSNDEAQKADELYDVFEGFEKEPSPRKQEADAYVGDEFEPATEIEDDGLAF